jgi:hypothetical protein
MICKNDQLRGAAMAKRSESWKISKKTKKQLVFVSCFSVLLQLQHVVSFPVYLKIYFIEKTKPRLLET